MINFYVVFRGSRSGQSVRLRMRYDSLSKFFHALRIVLDDFISSTGGLPVEIKLQQTND